MMPLSVRDLAAPAFKADPHPLYARLRAEAPAHPLRLPGGEVGWLVTRYADVLALLKDGRLAKDRANALDQRGRARQPWIPGFMRPLARNMLDLDAPDHARLRGLVHQAFTPRFVARLGDRVQALADELLDAPPPGGRRDLIRDYALPLPVAVIGDMLGVPPADRRRFHRWSRRIVAAASPRDALPTLPAIVAFLRFVRRLIAARRAEPGDDLVSALLRARDGADALSEDELVAMIFLLLVAGHETTVNLIGTGTLALLRHPAQLVRLRASPELLPSAVEELLRYTSPVEIATERFAREPLAVAGVAIPRGAQVLAVLGAANRDERQFARPDDLDLAREPNRHLAFGQGAHFCLGAPLARLEGRIALATLLRRAPGLRLAAPADALRWRRSLVLRGLEQLPVAF